MMRIKGLDFLRGIAIIGVLFRHFETDFFLSGPGGYGVDLFFVLSGFLVSGLLFTEYKRKHAVNVRRFLIRRGFKIYPAFYFFIAVTICLYSFGFKSYFPASAILSEVFFLQSYFHPMWGHTWSLAVEEHFYLLLAFLIFLSVKKRWIENRQRMILIMTGFVLLSFCLRLIYVFTSYRETVQPFYYTHLRIDGLFTGALLGYLWHFKQELIGKFYEKKTAFGCVMILFAAPAFMLDTADIFMVTVGFNLLHIAFVIAILFAISLGGEKVLFGNKITRTISKAICYIGVYSYSIYLWHLPVQNLLLRLIPDLRTESIVYLIAAVTVGVLASYAIEKPMLRLRDQYFPSE
jgi:peptidoglycan/LPS O-acetylase OafA/YrhL